MSKDPVPLKAVHHVEFYVGNAKQAAFYYRKAFGYNQTAYSGLETGDREKASYVLEQGRVRLVFSTPLNGNNELLIAFPVTFTSNKFGLAKFFCFEISDLN